jgi:hypothetical protein
MAKTAILETATEAAPKPVERHYIQESRMQLANHARVTWHISIVAEMPYDGVFLPENWKNIAHKLKPFDKLELLREDGAWEADLRVIDAGTGWVKVAERVPPLYYSTTPSDRAIAIDGHTIKWMGPHGQYAVIRDSDKTKLMGNIPTRDGAMTWLSGHLKALAA